MRTRADSPNKTCTREGCTKPLRAKGLCATHYNQTLPNRHRKVMVACDCCGVMAEKYTATSRYTRTYCSMLCRDYERWGGQACDLPATHWARMFGATCDWKPPAPKTTFVSNTCNDCGTKFVEELFGTASDYCSDQCKKKAHRRRRRAREFEAPGDFRWVDIMRQYRRQGYTCAYCKQSCDGLPEPEHVTPLSRGGRNDMSNLVAACHLCNSDKCDLTLEEWAADRKRRKLQPVDTTLNGTAFKHLIKTQPNRPAGRHMTAA